MKRFCFQATILILVCMVLVSCNRQADEPVIDIHHDNILRCDVNALLTTLDPLTDAASEANRIYPLLYSHLFIPDEKGELKPDLVASWQYDPDRFSWHVQIRNDAFFHNNEPVTAADVKCSIENYIKKIRPSVWLMINDINVLSDTDLVFKLNRNDTDFFRKIWDFEIVKHTQANGGSTFQPIGSGPFKLKYQKEGEVMLVANDKYYDGRPSLDGVIYYCQPDKENTWTRLLSGKTDIAWEISPKNYEMLKSYTDRFNFYEDIIPFYTLILYNASDPLFSDARVRSALTYAIDRERIVSDILKGFGVVAVSPVGIKSSYHDPGIKPLPFNPQKALELLQQAGWSYDENTRCMKKGSTCFEFTLFVFEESQVEKQVAEFIKLSLNDIGIRTRVQAVGYEELKRRYGRNNEFQAVLTEFVDAQSWIEYFAELWSPYSTGRAWAGCFEDKEVTRLLNLAVAGMDMMKKKELMHHIEFLMVSLQPATCLYHQSSINIISKRFSTKYPVTLTYEGIYKLRYVTLNNASGIKD